MGKRNLVKLKRITVEEDSGNSEQNRENFKQVYIEVLYQYYKNQMK